MKDQFGNALIEILICLVVAGIMVGVSIPHLTRIAAKGKIRSATRCIAAIYRQARWEAVTKGKYVGIEFRKENDIYVFRKFEDGNGNGIRRADIASGTDILIEGPQQLKNRYGKIDFSILQGMLIRSIPPGSGYIENVDDPIKLGRSDIASFSPRGDSSSGTVYISDERHTMMAVVLFGPTARVRVWEYVFEENKWR